MNLNRIKYSRGQQIIFVVLSCFIIGCFAINLGIKNFHPYKENSFIPDSTVIARIKNFENKLDSIEWQYQREFSPHRKINLPHEKFKFDPNTIDSISILKLGFQPYMAHNWLQYRRYKGKIYNHKKLRAIYGIDTLLVDSLKDFMVFHSVKPTIKDSSIIYKPKDFFTFELNSADTALLNQLPGIGNSRASMIVAHRKNLGGFYSIEQLREIENLPDSVIDKITPYISIEHDSIKKININHVGIKHLHKHPYISYYQAKAIYDLRWDKQHNGKIKSLDELLKLKEFDKESFEKVKIYLEIN